MFLEEFMFRVSRLSKAASAVRWVREKKIRLLYLVNPIQKEQNVFQFLKQNIVDFVTFGKRRAQQLEEVRYGHFRQESLRTPLQPDYSWSWLKAA